MSLSIQHISKSFGNQKAVDDFSLEAQPGEIVGLLGPNGAGKSTTMKMICGCTQADGGQITIDGIQLSASPKLAKSKIGYLPESNPLYPEMYVKEFLQFCAGIHQISNVTQRIEEVIEQTGLTKEQHKKIHQLSKGYKQRVGIAQAILHDPQVLIFDEPISGLDPNQLIEIRTLIKSFSQNKTVLFSSHIMQEVEEICDRVVILNQGQIVDDRLIDSRQVSAANSLIKVHFEESVDVSQLAESEFVKGNPSKKEAFYLVNTNDELACKKYLFDYAVQHKNRILEMSLVTERLEDVFKKLTKQK